MSRAGEILRSSPGKSPVDEDLVTRCIEACFECEQACAACADACVGEDERGGLVACIRLDLACSEICSATGRIVSRELAGDPGMGPVILEACEKSCDLCAEECERHAGSMEHCRVCAEAARNCQSACRKLREALPG